MLGDRAFNPWKTAALPWHAATDNKVLGFSVDNFGPTPLTAHVLSCLASLPTSFLGSDVVHSDVMSRQWHTPKTKWRTYSSYKRRMHILRSILILYTWFDAYIYCTIISQRAQRMIRTYVEVFVFSLVHYYTIIYYQLNRNEMYCRVSTLFTHGRSQGGWFKSDFNINLFSSMQKIWSNESWYTDGWGRFQWLC